jgi:hypothetical protein
MHRLSMLHPLLILNIDVLQPLFLFSIDDGKIGVIDCELLSQREEDVEGVAGRNRLEATIIAESQMLF